MMIDYICLTADNVEVFVRLTSREEHSPTDEPYARRILRLRRGDVKLHSLSLRMHLLRPAGRVARCSAPLAACCSAPPRRRPSRRLALSSGVAGRAPLRAGLRRRRRAGRAEEERDEGGRPRGKE